MADTKSTPGGEGIVARRAAVVSCRLCGIDLHKNQMVPDGTRACTDVRWFCQDVRARTERVDLDLVPESRAISRGCLTAMS
jgi:hypothetical protein